MKVGLDLSSTVCGLALSNNNNKIVEAQFLDISKVESYKDKSIIIIKKIDEWFKKYNDVSIFNVEGALNAFTFGKTNAQSMIKLIKTNAVITYILEQQYPMIKINSLNVNSVRKGVFGKCRIKGIKSKLFVEQELYKLHPYIKSFEVINKRGNPDKKNEDMRDACVLALFG